MKVLFDHSSPFLLAHGGFQIQIESTKRALEEAGVEVEFLRWWDSSQGGDVIHFFGLPAAELPHLARRKGIRFVFTHLLGGLGARSLGKRIFQKILLRSALGVLPSGVLNRIGWSVWRSADAYVAVTPWEAKLMVDVFHAPRERVHVIPNGVDQLFFEQPVEPRGEWIVTTASIFPVKRLTETASAAVSAGTPYRVIGRPLSESDQYYREFCEICRAHPKILRYDNVMRSHAELAKIYRQARGFVLLSRWETQSLSALEAAACECPLFLSDLPWARSTFQESAVYCPVGPVEVTGRRMRAFYDRAPQLAPPIKPLQWNEVGQMLKAVYSDLVKNTSIL